MGEDMIKKIILAPNVNMHTIYYTDVSAKGLYLIYS